MPPANCYRNCFRLRVMVLSAIALAAVSVFPPTAPAGEPPAIAAPVAPAAKPAPAAATGSAPTGRQVRAAIFRAVDRLRNLQGPGGRWADYAQDGGVTALVTYALLEAAHVVDGSDDGGPYLSPGGDLGRGGRGCRRLARRDLERKNTKRGRNNGR